MAAASEKKSEALSRTKSAVDALSKAESANDGVVDSVNMAAARKNDLEKAIEAKRVFLAGDVPHTELKSQSQVIRSQFDPLISDTNMLDALQSLLSKTQENRGQFDGMVLKQFDEECTKVLSSLVDSINNGDQQKAQSQAEFAQAREAKEQAINDEVQMVELHKNAVMAKKDADASLKAARSHVKTLESAIRSLTTELKQCNEEVQKFQVGPKQSWDALLHPNEPRADEADEMQLDAETVKPDEQEPDPVKSDEKETEPVKQVMTIEPADAVLA